MNKIKQAYQVDTLKYHKGKLLYNRINEQGFKIVDSENFSSFVSSISTHNLKSVRDFWLLGKFNYLEKNFIKFDKQLQIVNKNLLIFIKKRTEQIEVQGVADQRSYQFVRVVIKEIQANPRIEEFYPEYFDVEEILSFVKKIIDSEMEKDITLQESNIELFGVEVMLSPQAAGFFIHETIGHLLEEDIYQYFSEKLNNINFPKSFSLSDAPIGYEHLIGINTIDDYGQKIFNQPLVRNGKIINHIRMREGFARSESIDHKPLARMRMLILDNTSKVKEKKIRPSKIYVSKIHSGQVIPANFSFRLKGEGNIIINSYDDRKLVSNISLSGDLKKAIESIYFIGRQQKVFSADCTKNGQTIRVGSKSPSVGFVCGKVNLNG